MTTQLQQRKNAGVPDPLDPRRHRVVTGTSLFAGAAITNGGVLDATIPCAGALSMRIRILTAGAGGTLSFAYLAPDGETAYTTNNPASVAVVAGTESVATFTPFGEGWVRVRLTGSGTGTVTYVDQMQV